jgi:ankyrin repeat protein
MLSCKPYPAIFQNGDTSLHIAAAMGRRKLTRLLAECGTDPELRNKQVSCHDKSLSYHFKLIISYQTVSQVEYSRVKQLVR